jgi:hypothetical protein
VNADRPGRQILDGQVEDTLHLACTFQGTWHYKNDVFLG